MLTFTWFQLKKKDMGTSRLRFIFKPPVFRRDVLWYGDVRPSVRPSVRLSVRVSIRPFSEFFSYMLWHIELKFCTWLCFNVLQIKFECGQFPSIFVGVMSLLELRILKYTVFRTFLLHALTYWAEILHMTLFDCTTDQVWVSSISVNFCWELCPFWNVKYWKYTVFRTFLLHPLTYWAEILHLTLFYCTTDQVGVSSISVNFSWELCPFWNVKYWKYTVFRTFHLHALTYWAEILHFILFYCTTDQVWVSSISVNFCRSSASFGT